ncbi:hypothetical protein EI42_05657 [Thermosporothrix hazakensis]|jgi:hypothetical protein|uniref:Uncharacterized protein n=1 Tax=Thermosporothrix hazakensis TaxID=644383 RepID=A0A326TVN0_THEHA|nr:hypothetical protein EI42_05657 [Thermosporothrix hazakensis]GCE50714.1 hypothetical protein KTH_55830 [Thermosporothrix hazakensis]
MEKQTRRTRKASNTSGKRLPLTQPKVRTLGRVEQLTRGGGDSKEFDSYEDHRP